MLVCKLPASIVRLSCPVSGFVAHVLSFVEAKIDSHEEKESSTWNTNMICCYSGWLRYSSSYSIILWRWFVYFWSTEISVVKWSWCTSPYSFTWTDVGVGLICFLCTSYVRHSCWICSPVILPAPHVHMLVKCAIPVLVESVFREAAQQNDAWQLCKQPTSLLLSVCLKTNLVTVILSNSD